MGQLVADHLLQEASRERRCTRVPASTWDALLSHVHGPADALRLGDSAGGRLLYRYTVPLYQRAIDVGDELAQFRLVNLRPWDEGWDEVIHMLSEGSDIASELARQGDADGLRAQADPGNGYAFPALAELLLRRGDLDEAVKIPRARADVGDVNVRQLAGLLKQQGRGEEAERLCRCGLAPDGSIAQAW